MGVLKRSLKRSLIWLFENKNISVYFYQDLEVLHFFFLKRKLLYKLGGKRSQILTLTLSLFVSENFYVILVSFYDFVSVFCTVKCMEKTET